MFDNLFQKTEKDQHSKKRIVSKANRHKKSDSNKKYGPSKDVLHQIGLGVATNEMKKK